MSIPSSNLRTFAHRQCRHWFPVKAKELAACRQSAAGAGESAVLARVGSSSSHVNTSPAARAGRRKDGASTGSKPSLRTTYALSHEANANTGLTTEAGERMTVCEKRRGVLLGAWYGNVRSMSAIFAAGPASKESAGQPNSAYAAAAAGRVRQTTGSHSMGMAWHGMACCRPRVAQHLVFGSCQNTSFTAMCPSDTSRPARSRLWCNGMA